MTELNLIDIDPGAITGYSVFAQGELVRAGFVRREDLFVLGALPPPKSFGVYPCIRHVLIELPQHRVRGGGKGDPNDLITLAVLVGEIKRHYEQQGCTVELVLPVTWKGSVPKDIHGQWILDKLTPAERAVMQKRPRAKTPENNMVDAIGLGLWKLGRFRVR